MKKTGTVLIGSWLLAAALAAGATTTVQPLALPAWRELPAKAGGPLPQPASVRFEPRKLVDDTAALLRDTPAARFDLEARAAELPRGLEPAFALVRDEIRFDGYPGAMRGADGTYAARAGNAADRALLLARILELQDVRTRFALGRLSGEDAEVLYGQIFAEPRKPGSGAGATARVAEADDLTRRVAARARRDYGVVRAALGEALPAATTGTREEVLTELQSHVWVQAEVDGKWVDLDPAFPGAEVGRARVEPTETCERLPEDWYQKLTVRVIEERLGEDGLSETKVLEVAKDAPDWSDAQIVLGHAPAAEAAGVGGLGVGQVGRGTDAWVPVLLIDGEQCAGEAIVFGTSQSSVTDFFGGGGGESTFVAEWLELELTLPGGRSEVNRRVLVDRGSAAWRAVTPLRADTLRPLARNDKGVKAVQALYNLWVNSGGHDVRHFAEGLNALGTAMVARKPGEAPGTVSFDTQAWVFSLQNYAWLLASDNLALPALNDSPDIRFYPDSPRIAVFAVGLDPCAEQDTPYVQTDLRRDHLRGVARQSGAEAALAERRLWFGLLEGALEHEFLAEQAAGSGAAADRVSTTSSSLDAAGVLVFGGGFPGDPADAHPEAAARMRRALDRGAVLVAPRRALASADGGWWEIAGDSGEVRAVAGPDLGCGNFLPYYTNAAAPEFAYEIDELGNVIRKIRLRPGLYRVPPRKGGNEYLLTIQVTWTTLGSVVMAAGTSWFAYVQIKHALR